MHRDGSGWPRRQDLFEGPAASDDARFTAASLRSLETVIPPLLSTAGSAASFQTGYLLRLSFPAYFLAGFVGVFLLGSRFV